jgi:DNA-binding LytR/AlgR family response regulator
MIPENFRINGDILAIPVGKNIKIIRIPQIVSLKSCKIGTYICNMIKNDSTVCPSSLDAFEAVLAPRGFFRIHDNCIVNTYFVERVDKCQGQ